MAAMVLAAASPGYAQQTPAPAPGASNGDPLEPMNRTLFAFNGVLDRLLLRPVAMGYRRLLPRPVRKGVHNVLGNLGEPLVFANDLLQFRVRQAGKTAARFAGNSTLGLLGVFDVARGAGLPHHDNSFGDTLGRAGVGPGPYLFLPVVGPTTLRGLIGGGVDLYIDPINRVRHVRSTTLEATVVVVGAVDQRVEAEADIKELSVIATDPYATLRSVYLQQTAARIAGDDLSLEPLPEAPAETPRSPPAAPPPATPPPATEAPANPATEL